MFNSKSNMNSRSRKRSFKLRGEKPSLNLAAGQMNVLNHKMSEIKELDATVVSQCGKGTFPFAFTKHFGIKDVHEQTPIRFHVICKSELGNRSKLFHGSFSFMLYAPLNCDWDNMEVEVMLKE